MLKFLGKGSSREVYDLGNKLVLKKSYNKAGIEQNRNEVHNNIIKDLGTRVYSWSEDYSFIVVEKASVATENDFLKLTGKPFEFTKNFVLAVRKFIVKKISIDILYAKVIEENDFLKNYTGIY